MSAPSRRWIWLAVGTFGAAAALLVSGRLRGGDGVGWASMYAGPLLVGTLAGVGWPQTPVRRAFTLAGLTLLCALPLMGEGVLCLIVLAPWYAVGAPLTAAGVGWAARRYQLGPWAKAAMAATAAALLLGAPALDRPALRALAPVTLSDTVVLDAPAQVVWDSVERLHLDLEGDPPVWMRLLLPVPAEIRGGGASPGDERRAVFQNGVVVATVRAADPPHGFEVALSIEDPGREFFDHWVVLQDSTFTFVPLPDGRTAFTHTTTYRPRHAPRAFFQPIEIALGRRMQAYLLDAYARELRARLLARR